MLLKCCHAEKMNVTGNNQKRSTVGNMKPASVSQSVPRVQRKAVRGIAVKRSHRAVKEETTVDPVCDNSNDSGLGFEQHQDYTVALRLVDWPGDRLGTGHEQSWASENSEVKRKRLEIKIESDDANDNFSFPDSVRHRTQHLLSSPPYPVVEHMSAPGGVRPIKRCTTSHVFGLHKDNKPLRTRAPGPNVLTSQLLGLNKPRGKAMPSLVANQMTAASRNGKTQLIIVTQPEQQHRARYQTEGSRGAVKDRTGNGFPQVQLTGWVGAATLEVYVGSDCGKVVPHMFYQACRVSGKNSTQCQERTEEGTVIIEIPFEPTKDMVVTCDCVGILKERNVDVEHRFPDQSGSRNKKKSTRCRMVFRTFLTHPDGSQEMLQITSQPIACTQPPGVPEICKKSLTSSPTAGGLELFILGKNFLKDTQVLFTNPDLHPPWEVSVIPDKEYLQQSHLVCVVPPYQSLNISESVTVRLTVTSSDKSSEAHSFTYTPQISVGTVDPESQSAELILPGVNPTTTNSEGAVRSPVADTSSHLCTTLEAPLNNISPKSLTVDRAEPTSPHTVQYFCIEPKQGGEKDSIFPLVLWKSAGSEGSKLMSVSSKAKDLKLFSLPAVRKNMQLGKPPALVPLLPRRPSSSEVKSDEGESRSGAGRDALTTELKGVDLRVKLAVGDGVRPVAPSLKIPMATGADLSNARSPSMATLRRFVADDTGSPLPSLSVENFLSHLEQKPENPKNGLKDFPPQVDCKALHVNAAASQPAYVPLESDFSKSIPLVIQGPGFQRLSEEKISDCVEPSLDVHGKPCATPGVGTLHYTSQVTPTTTEPNENITVMPVANLMQNVSREQVKFCSVSPNVIQVQDGVPVKNLFLSQDLINSSAGTCNSGASDTIGLQAPTDVSIQLHMENSAESMSGAQQSSDMRIPINYSKENESAPVLQSKDVSNSKCETSVDNLVIETQKDESLHSPPRKCEDRLLPQEPMFRICNDHIATELPSTEYNMFLNSSHPVVVNNFVRDAVRTSSICLPPAQPNAVAEPSQVLPELGNNHNSLHFSPVPPIAEGRGSSSYVVSDVPLSSCSPPLAVKSIQVHSQGSPVYTNYVQKNVSLMNICQPQMPKENITVIKDCSPNLEVFATKCQTLKDGNSCTMHGSTESNTLHVVCSKTENDFVVKDQLMTATSTVHIPSKNSTLCSPHLTPLYNYTTNNAISSPSNCVSSPNRPHLDSNEHSNAIEKSKLLACAPSTARNSYNLVQLQDNIMIGGAISVVPGEFTAGVSIDTRKPETCFGRDLQEIAVTNPLCPLPSTVDNMLVGSDHLATLHESPTCPPESKGNIPASLDMSNLLLQRAVTMDNGSHTPEPCPSSVIMKDMILNSNMLSNENTVSSTCMPVGPSLSLDTIPVLHTYTNMCSDNSSQVAVKDMMMGAGMPSSVHDLVISQSEAVSPGTVRLDALVNSTLKNHLNSTHATAGTNQVEVRSADPLQHCTANSANNGALTTNLLDNIFSLNHRGEGPRVPSLVATTERSEITTDVVHQAANSSKSVQLTSSSKTSAHFNGGGFQSEQVTADSTVGFTAVPKSAQFGVAPGIHFTSAPSSLHFTTNSAVLGLGQLMDLQGHHAKADQKAKHTDGVVSERREEGMLSHELTQMSDHDLISYINPSCFDQV